MRIFLWRNGLGTKHVPDGMGLEVGRLVVRDMAAVMDVGAPVGGRGGRTWSQGLGEWCLGSRKGGGPGRLRGWDVALRGAPLSSASPHVALP